MERKIQTRPGKVITLFCNKIRLSKFTFNESVKAGSLDDGDKLCEEKFMSWCLKLGETGQVLMSSSYVCESAWKGRQTNDGHHCSQLL